MPIHGTASYPGVVAVEGAQYTTGHGITPGVCVLRCSPQDDPPDAYGDLVFDDGETTITIPSCRLEQLVVETDDRGRYWSLTISDRRWAWNQTKLLNGCYNQLDPHGKLLPWSIRSPTELAVLCLEAMGETGYTIDLPPGLNYPGPFAGPIVNITGTNPPVNWDGIPPAQALQQLADSYGCRVVYQLSSDTVSVGPPGVGAALPPGSVHQDTPSLKAPLAPDAVGVIGSPTRYQMRIQMEPVGKEWDGSYQPINQLSYAPLSPAQPGKPAVWDLLPQNPANQVSFQFQVWPPAPANKPVPPAVFVSYFSTAADLTTICNGIAAAINAIPALTAFCTAAVSPPVNPTAVLVTGSQPGTSFAITPAIPGGTGILNILQLQEPEQPQKGGVPDWSYSAPPLFANVNATSRLTKLQAQQLAQESVFRCYRPTGQDVSGQGFPYVPGYGTVTLREQLVLQNTQVDQVIPTPLDPNLLDANGQQTVLNFYNGYAHDKPAAVFGQVGVLIASRGMGLSFNPAVFGKAPNLALNTAPGAQVLVPFTIDAVLQVLTFAQAVYYSQWGRCFPPQLTLQTAVLVRAPDTNQLISYTRFLPLGTQTGAGVKYDHHPDVQCEVTSLYDNFNRLLAWTILDSDCIIRSDYYLQAAAAQYRVTGGETVVYNGLVGVDLDGLTQQITWSVGGNGAETTVSQNTEHSIYYPPYPARRRAEFLPAIVREAPKAGRVLMPKAGPSTGTVTLSGGS